MGFALFLELFYLALSQIDQQLPFTGHVVGIVKHLYMIQDTITLLFMRSQKVIIRNPESQIVVGAIDVVESVSRAVGSFVGSV